MFGGCGLRPRANCLVKEMFIKNKGLTEAISVDTLDIDQ
jgi:hypothetical protein